MSSFELQNILLIIPRNCLSFYGPQLAVGTASGEILLRTGGWWEEALENSEEISTLTRTSINYLQNGQKSGSNKFFTIEKAHNAAITQVIFTEFSLYSCGMDSAVKRWYFGLRNDTK